VVDTPLLPTLISSLQTPAVEGIMEDTIAVGVDAWRWWRLGTLNAVIRDE
jgi:hypothetical protein